MLMKNQTEKKFYKNEFLKKNENQWNPMLSINYLTIQMTIKHVVKGSPGMFS